MTQAEPPRLVTTSAGLINVAFTVAVILVAGFVVHRFFLPVAWAGILAIATWPLFLRVNGRLGGRRTLTAILLTVTVLVVIAVPLIWLGGMMADEIKAFVGFLARANSEGMPAPPWVSRIPAVGDRMLQFWNDTLAEPGWVSKLLESEWLGQVGTAGGVVRAIGALLLTRLVVLLFALLALFFFYRDGDELIKRLDIFGRRWLGDRWNLHSSRIPGAIRATVNGIVLVGLAEGIVLGVAYAFAGVPSPVLLGAVTAVLAMIPFGAPLGFGAIALYLLAQNHVGGALGVAITGLIVLFVADHFVRPAMIGGATRLPFLLVLFGILGGVETMGLVGLFLGPVAMVLFMTLWDERSRTARA